jgi:hypothetical protein
MENLDNDQKDAILRMKQGQNVFLKVEEEVEEFRK